MNDTIITDTLDKLAQFKPKSVFLYGSRGRGDAKPDSDYEIGVIFDDDKYVQRSNIHAAISNPQVKTYPFKWGELSRGTFGHVFQKSIYMREIVKGGQTIAGEHLVEQIPPPPITILDLIQRLRFDIGMALAAILSYRTGDMQTSMEEFSKSCLFGLRCLEILELKTFPLGYEEIYELSGELVVEPEYRRVIEAAYAQRKDGEVPSIDVLFENISLLDTFIEPKILAVFNAQGNVEIV
ncbi:MAG TPA: nucleotidyltransferase domain-containing protein [Candidatus Limnocylindria bacterium]|nr:nucleotidyltransferase domain-containing protein [Candidatus Limnocylindria bacterium]